MTKFRFADFSNNNTVSPLIFVKRLPDVRRVLMNDLVFRTPTSYGYNAIAAPDAVTCGNHGTCSGSGFADQKDDCDCEGINFISVNPKDDPNNAAGAGLAAEGQ